MKILVTGAKGQLGIDLVRLLTSVYQVVGLHRNELDVTQWPIVREVVRRLNPDVIIHSAAYTKVDQAEMDQDAAYLVNAYGTRNVAVAARQVGAKLVYISTDYVFDGCCSRPYHEFERPNPINVYGKSKLAGEEMVQTYCDRSFIVRTSWLYGKHGENFVRNMLKLAREREEIHVVDDQVGSPTYTVDLALFIKELISTEQYGIYHATNSGSCSWYQFAAAIFAEVHQKIEITPIQTKDFSRPAPRPRYSVLDHMAIRLNGFSPFRHWREALRECLSQK